jgi:hypothetical protein
MPSILSTTYRRNILSYNDIIIFYILINYKLNYLLTTYLNCYNSKLKRHYKNRQTFSKGFTATFALIAHTQPKLALPSPSIYSYRQALTLFTAVLTWIDCASTQLFTAVCSATRRQYGALGAAFN